MWPVEHLIQWDAGFFDHQIFWKESIEILVFLHGVSHQGRVAPDWRSDATGHTRSIVEVSDPHFSWWLPPCKKSYFLKNVWLMPSRDIDDQRILQYDWTRHTTGHIQPKVVVSNPSFSWWLSPCKKNKVSIDFFQVHWWSKNSTIWLDERHNWSHPTKSESLRSFLLLMVISMQKLWDINWFFPQTLMLGESCNLIEWEIQLATPIQNW